MTRETFQVLQALEYLGFDFSRYAFIDAHDGTDARELFPTSDDVELKGYCLCLYVDNDEYPIAAALPHSWSYIIHIPSMKIYIYSLK